MRGRGWGRRNCDRSPFFARSTGDFMPCLFSGGRGVGRAGGRVGTWEARQHQQSSTQQFGWVSVSENSGAWEPRGELSARRVDAEGDSLLSTTLWCGPLKGTAAAGNQSASPTVAPSCSCSCIVSKSKKVFGTVAFSFVCDKYYPIID